MRFAVEEINNSTSLLPNVSLGYEIFDYCSDSHNLQAALDFLSKKLTRVIPVVDRITEYLPKVLTVIGPFGTTESLVIAPLFGSYGVPMISPGASSLRLSDKINNPSFLRTIPSDKNQVRVIIQLLRRFNWNWVAFVGSGDDYSNDALREFDKEARLVGICVPYQTTLPQDTSKIGALFDSIATVNVSVVVVFSTRIYAIPFIKAAVANNVRDKVWIASEAWSMNEELARMPGIDTIGTVIGITTGGLAPLEGFEEFVRKTLAHRDGEICSDSSRSAVEETCNQDCPACANVTLENLLSPDPSYRLRVYSSVYLAAHALHQLLGCDAKYCRRSDPVLPHMVLKKLKTVNFTLYGRTIKFDVNGDPIPSYDFVVWDRTSPRFYKKIGSYTSDPEPIFVLNASLIRWFSNGTVPVLTCSAECEAGYRRTSTGAHSCCFDCEPCLNGTFVNHTADPYKCVKCETDEWSENGSSCTKRSQEYLHYTDLVSIGLFLSATILISLSIAVGAVFVWNRNTPVVKSAGGKMCFFMLGCLIVSCTTIFSFHGVPHGWTCMLRFPVFTVFYTACLSCLTVRSFQIVFIFKMAAKLPKAYDFWVKHNGQWLTIMACVAIQIILCTIWIGVEGPRPFNNTVAYKDQIIFQCSLGNLYGLFTVTSFTAFLSILCFGFSYMGTDLPKNYNEAKSITISLLVLFISWISYFTSRMVYQGKYLEVINAGSVLSTLYGILLCYFVPKCCIILFKPDQNTPAHFQSCIQNYTKTISTK
uniref:Taste receptor type 1 member 1-like n=1 Tax=Lepisosteus oculatus TaxID=7918 RepID=W5MD11_LEPOC|nr:PREDICTED: taste receptor type 1 member 1-like [Lepisosteus oculatus]XP_015192566.1 PREDICTED: taste receptor type 1 member 1-like [Lepisosteus oculatus]